MIVEVPVMALDISDFRISSSHRGNCAFHSDFGDGNYFDLFSHLPAAAGDTSTRWLLSSLAGLPGISSVYAESGQESSSFHDRHQPVYRFLGILFAEMVSCFHYTLLNKDPRC
jgi:hypothetical protein